MIASSIRGVLSGIVICAIPAAWTSQAANTKELEFTAEIRERGFDQFERRYTEAHRSDGSVAQRWDVTYPNGVTQEAKVIEDAVNRTRTTVVALTGSITTVRSERALASPVTCPAADPRIPPILGFALSRTIREQRLPNGTVVGRTEFLQAPELNCIPLRVNRYTLRNGAEELQSVQEAMAIHPGAPDPRLFAIPANYTERSPSQAMAETAKLLGTRCTTCQSSYKLLDDAYFGRLGR